MANGNAGNSIKTGKKKATSGSFKPGQSGNPKGRPKQTPQQKEALQAIRELAGTAAHELKKMLEDEKTPPAQRVKVIEMILERAYGRPEAKVEVSAPDNGIMDEIKRRMAGGAN